MTELGVQRINEAFRMTCENYGVDPDAPMDKTLVRKLPFPEGDVLHR